jgi:uncharacterized protein HemX
VPLSRQEKFSRQMMQLQQDKQKLELELKQVREVSGKRRGGCGQKLKQVWKFSKADYIYKVWIHLMP